jgi:hypothetical protein
LLVVAVAANLVLRIVAVAVVPVDYALRLPPLVAAAH